MLSFAVIDPYTVPLYRWCRTLEYGRGHYFAVPQVKTNPKHGKLGLVYNLLRD